ncbi:uncharacterized protein K02A2.6-like [Anopheles ziemanni]|uniref:uncharacterized protein K02A2.6-like n=1 Tax=Anopheles coustani TaxID=139045 RepID=UPI0026581E56|nr:uncharacterized protein K02A2.6-like [Anopheles coustani]XP_058177357.1 uncharacterized protein K02A2.6-like [Anopheles ziemanni]
MNNAAEQHTDEQRRSSGMFASASSVLQPSPNGTMPHTLPEATPEQHHHPAPSQNPSAPPSLPQLASASPSSDNGVILQMMQLLQQQISQQQQWMANMLQQVPMAKQADSQREPNDPEIILNALAESITEFHHDAEAGITFGAWYDRYEDLFDRDACRLSDSAKVRLLGRKLGTAEHNRFTSFILPRASRDLTFAETVTTLKGLFGSKESLLSKRHRCFNTSKARGEDLLGFACRVNKACVDAELSAMTEEQFKCLMLVSGLKDEEDRDIRVKLLARIEQHPEITLQQLSEECNRIVTLKEDSARIEAPAHDRVLAVQSGKPANQRFRRPTTESGPKTACWLCGELHWVRDCPFRSNKCDACHKVGHKTGFCKPKRFRRHSGKHHGKRRTAIRVVTVDVRSVQKRRRFAAVIINGVGFEMQLDTASDITVIDRTAWTQLGSPHLAPPSVIARSASGGNVHLDGEFSCTVSMGHRSTEATIRVANAGLLLLGTDLVDALDLWTLPMDKFCRSLAVSAVSSGNFHERFPKVFNGTGLPKRPVAYALQDTVNRELDRLEQLKVITPVTSSDWAAPVVVVRKANGQVRICGDYSTGLNSALQPYEYPLPLPEDIFARLANCTIFSKIDLSDAFLQVEIAPQYRPMLTINTHRGLYTYNRLPPGIKIAPAAFQQLMDTMLAGLTGVSGYLDDIIIGAATVQEHDAAVTKVLERMQEYGLTVRQEKCVFRTRQIQYLGHIIDKDGLRPSPEKIEVIRRLPEPANITDVRAFLGAINYYGKTPGEVMFGRKLRTSLELLKPPPSPVKVHPSSEIARQFRPADPVYVKMYSGNNWNWIAGTVVNRHGRVMYEVITEDNRNIRRHINQMRKRAHSTRDAPIATKSQQLPLEILLDEWHIPPLHAKGPTPTANSSSTSASSSSQQCALSSPSVQVTAPAGFLVDPDLPVQSRYRYSSHDALLVGEKFLVGLTCTGQI